MTLLGSSAGRTFSCKNACSCRPNPGTTVPLRTLSLSLSLARSLARSCSLFLPPFLSLSLSHRQTHTYARVWWRMVEWLEFGDVRHDTAVSLYPTSASFNTYRLPYTPIASLISHIGYARLISTPSYPISATSIDEMYEALCACVCARALFSVGAEAGERGD